MNNDFKVNAIKHPILFALMQKGIVEIESTPINSKAFVGIASDGNKVQLGESANNTERYLKWAPTPDKW